jgi:hypothetical protein
MNTALFLPRGRKGKEKSLQLIILRKTPGGSPPETASTMF